MIAPSDSFTRRYRAAVQFRDAEKPYIQEVLQFCCPGRERDFDRRLRTKGHEDTQVYISDGETLASDLASDLVTYFTPPEARWAEYLVNMEVPQAAKRRVLELVGRREEDLFSLIEISNYYDVAKGVFFECASHGTLGMWMDIGHISQPIYCEVVPPHELLVTPGHLGILDRFREKMVPMDFLTPMFAQWVAAGVVNLETDAIKKKRQVKNAQAKVCWGFWVDWSDPGNPRWFCEITVDGERVTPAQPVDLGPLAGSCPLLVGRFNPQPGIPWGRGPGRTALADMRVLDKIEELILTGMDQAVLPTIFYADDGLLDLSDGIIAGRAYPSRHFSRDNIYEMSRNVKVEYATDAKQIILDRIRTAFYQDGPRQRGDTPPTASQWLDERRRVQQRLGKPSAPLWTEFVLSMIQRFEALGVQMGRLEEAISHNGTVISVLPISPLQKAQNQDKVMVARSNLGLAFEVFQDQVGNFIDPVETFQKIVRASGDDLTVVREEEIQPDAAA